MLILELTFNALIHRDAAASLTAIRLVSTYHSSLFGEKGGDFTKLQDQIRVSCLHFQRHQTLEELIILEDILVSHTRNGT